MRDVLVGDLYHHFKGHDYKVLCIAKNSESLEDMVVYENIISHEIWCRPYKMFNGLVDANKYPKVRQKYRFEKIKEEIEKWDFLKLLVV